jgi:subtilisin family serine protease
MNRPGLRRLLVLAYLLPFLTLIQAPAAQGGGIERELAKALKQPIPRDGLAVVATFRDGDLPHRGAARRQRIAERRERILAALPPGQFRVARRYEVLPAVALLARPEAIEALGRHPEVKLVHLDGTLHAFLAEGVPLIGGDHAHDLGFTGAGVSVAVLDTGIDTDHPDLVSSLEDERCFCAYPLLPTVGCCPGGATSGTGPGSAEDGNGHGTAVSGIISSDGIVAAEGIAPDAGIVAVKVLSNQGTGRYSDIGAGLDWVLQNHAALGIRAVNLSAGDLFQHQRSDRWPCVNSNVADAIKALHADGVAVFVASGNNGYDNGIAFPACVEEAVSVGGVYDASFGARTWCRNARCTRILCTDDPADVDTFVCHSNSGAILDLLAPNYETLTCWKGGGTIAGGGTSFSSPYAAGAAALLFQADPLLTPDEALTLLESHGPQVTNPENGLSFTRIDVGGALDELTAP